MKTLKELFDEHGSVWLALKNDPTTRFFKPLGYSEKTKGFLIGEANKEDSSLAVDYKNGVLDYFILYEEPKPKVKRYKYAFKRGEDNIPNESCCFYKDDEEFLKDSLRVTSFKRLDSTMQEFDW